MRRPAPISLSLSLSLSRGQKIGRAPSEMHNNSGWGVDGATMAATEVRSISRLSVILTDLTEQELLKGKIHNSKLTVRT